MINDKSEIYENVNLYLKEISRLNTDNNIDEINKLRLNIFKFLRNVIKFYVDNNLFSAWEKNYLSRALGLVLWNSTKSKPSTSMLRACLSSIGKSATKTHVSTLDQADNIEEIDNLNESDFYMILDEIINKK